MTQLTPSKEGEGGTDCPLVFELHPDTSSPYSFSIESFCGYESVGSTDVLISDDNQRGFITNLESRQKGVGTKLLKQAFDFLRVRGYTQAIFYVHPWNGPALNCALNKAGAKVIRHSVDTYSEDEGFMIQKDLDRDTDGEEFDRGSTLFLPLPVSRSDFHPRRREFTSLLNKEGYNGIGIVTKVVSGERRNLLVLAKRREQLV